MDLIHGKVDQAEGLKSQIADEAKSNELFDQVMQTTGGTTLRDGAGSLADRPAQYMDWSAAGRKSFARRIAASMIGMVDGAKALLPAGESIISIPTLPADPIAEGKAPTSLLSVLSTVPIPAGGLARYVQQTQRVNAAAAVAVGGTKPTSQYGLTPVDIALKTYAHLSEAVDRFLIEDAETLATFLARELSFGWRRRWRPTCSTAPPAGTTSSDCSSGRESAPSPSRTACWRRRGRRSPPPERPGMQVISSSACRRPTGSSVELSTTSGSGEFNLATAPVDRSAMRLWGGFR